MRFDGPGTGHGGCWALGVQALIVELVEDAPEFAISKLVGGRSS